MFLSFAVPVSLAIPYYCIRFVGVPYHYNQTARTIIVSVSARRGLVPETHGARAAPLLLFRRLPPVLSQDAALDVDQGYDALPAALRAGGGWKAGTDFVRLGGVWKRDSRSRRALLVHGGDQVAGHPDAKKIHGGNLVWRIMHNRVQSVSVISDSDIDISRTMLPSASVVNLDFVHYAPSCYAPFTLRF